MRWHRDVVRKRATSVGKGLVVRGRPIIGNDGALIIGNDVVLDAAPVAGHLVSAPGGVLAIGDRVRIGQGAAISAEQSVTIGDDAVLGAFVTIMDTDFHVAGDATVRAAPEPVIVGERAVLGHQVILLPGTRVGVDARVAPGSVVSGTVPPGARVAGNPALPAEAGDAPSWAGRATIGEVVARVFHLPAPASPELTPDDVPDWDSLGALRLMLALEAAFSTIIDEQQMAEVTRVGDLERLVATAPS